MENERLQLIALNLDKQVGPRKAAAMLYRMYGQRRERLFGLATGIDINPPPEWIEPGEAKDHLGPAKRREAEVETRRASKQGASIITWLDSEYPSALRKSLHPPPVLYIKGEITPQDEIAVGIVGSRRATRDYIEFTYELSYRIAAKGVTIVSGLARGIDRAAHEGALAGGGRTIAVLGSGIDVIYPSEHSVLAERIASSGAVTSFFPMGTPPLPHHFPARNWVIASLCFGIVVVQGSRKSGAMITANFAGALGREVMAVPGHVEHAMSQGPHDLLRDGAVLVRSAEDVLECIDSALLFAGIQRNESKLGSGSSLEERIVERLTSGPAEVGDLAQILGAEVSSVIGALTRLEVSGRVSPLSQSRYRLRQDSP